ncbi:MAG: YihY/virulence factor BrkB family protein [Endomicrobiales bacterium]
MITLLSNLIKVSKIAFKKWVSKDPFRESAVIAYYAIFSLPGLLVIIISLAGYFFGRPAVINQVTRQIQSTLDANTAEQIHVMIVKMSQSKNSFWPTIIGIITIFIGATGVFSQLQSSFNTIWEISERKAGTGIWHVIKVRIFSFGLIVAVAIILVMSLLVSALLGAFGTWLANHFSQSFFIILRMANNVLSFIVLTVFFAVLFKFVPDAKIIWRQVWIGSLVTAILFEIGRFFLGLYFEKANPATAYGAAGSIILVMIWITYSAMITFYGAEFTRIYSGTRKD